MKAVTYLSLSVMMLLTACSNTDEPTVSGYGSPRDWTYGNDQIHFYINGVEQTSVSEITVSSTQHTNVLNNDVFPWYDTTLKVKGLLSKNKIFNIQVDADIERFEGTTVYDGVEYNVTGEYTGDPFEHYSKMGIIVYLIKDS